MTDDDELRDHVRRVVYEPVEPLFLALARWLSRWLSRWLL